MKWVMVNLLCRQESHWQHQRSLIYFSNHLSSGQAPGGSPGLLARPEPPPFVSLVLLGTLEVRAQWPVFRKRPWWPIESWPTSGGVGLRGYCGSTGTGNCGWDEAVRLNFGGTLTSLPPRIQI